MLVHAPVWGSLVMMMMMMMMLMQFTCSTGICYITNAIHMHATVVELSTRYLWLLTRMEDQYFGKILRLLTVNGFGLVFLYIHFISVCTSTWMFAIVLACHAHVAFWYYTLCLTDRYTCLAAWKMSDYFLKWHVSVVLSSAVVWRRCRKPWLSTVSKSTLTL